jgi:hypothetical protein
MCSNAVEAEPHLLQDAAAESGTDFVLSSSIVSLPLLGTALWEVRLQLFTLVSDRPSVLSIFGLMFLALLAGTGRGSASRTLSHKSTCHLGSKASR